VGAVLILDCRGYGTTSYRGISLASRYGNASASRKKLRCPRRPMVLLILSFSKTSNISYDQSQVRVRALGRNTPTWMFDVKKVGIISSVCICNGR